MIRTIGMYEWLGWGGGALAFMVLWYVARVVRRRRSAQHARQIESREKWARLFNPLAGGSVWAARRPSLGLRLGLIYFGVMALSILHQPIGGVVGILLLIWASTLWVAVILEKDRKKQEREKPPTIS